jgi:hypothetical protein
MTPHPEECLSIDKYDRPISRIPQDAIIFCGRFQGFSLRSNTWLPSQTSSG